MITYTEVTLRELVDEYFLKYPISHISTVLYNNKYKIQLSVDFH